MECVVVIKERMFSLNSPLMGKYEKRKEKLFILRVFESRNYTITYQNKSFIP